MLSTSHSTQSTCDTFSVQSYASYDAATFNFNRVSSPIALDRTHCRQSLLATMNRCVVLVAISRRKDYRVDFRTATRRPSVPVTPTRPRPPGRPAAQIAIYNRRAYPRIDTSRSRSVQADMHRTGLYSYIYYIALLFIFRHTSSVCCGRLLMLFSWRLPAPMGIIDAVCTLQSAERWKKRERTAAFDALQLSSAGTGGRRSGTSLDVEAGVAR